MWGEPRRPLLRSGLRVRREPCVGRDREEAVLLPSMTLDPGAGARHAPARPGKVHHRIGSFEPELDAAGENAVLIVHALTGDSHAGGEPDSAYKRGGWWSPVVGPGLPLDTEQYFVVCSNVLGGCYGSTGPASVDPESGRPYATRFPLVTIRDMVRVQRRLLDSLGVRRLALVTGGSIGGQQALEWAVEFPDFVEKA